MKKIYKNENSLIFQNQFFDLDTGQLFSPIETQNYMIIQVAESYYKYNCHIPRHLQHCDVEIMFPLTNGICCASNDRVEKVNKDEIYISFRGDYHEVSSRRSCRFRTIAVNFKEGPCLPMLDEIKKRFINKRKFFVWDIDSCSASIIAEFMCPEDPFFTTSLDSLISSIFVKFTRVGKEAPRTENLFAEETLPEIINYIDNHFLDMCSLDELSRHFGYTYNHICRIFRKTYDMTPNEYLLSKKMAYAAELLKKEKSISEIAEILGYSNPYNFSRAFKIYHGTSPTKYLKK